MSIKRLVDWEDFNLIRFDEELLAFSGVSDEAVEIAMAMIREFPFMEITNQAQENLYQSVRSAIGKILDGQLFQVVLHRLVNEISTLEEENRTLKPEFQEALTETEEFFQCLSIGGDAWLEKIQAEKQLCAEFGFQNIQLKTQHTIDSIWFRHILVALADKFGVEPFELGFKQRLSLCFDD